MSIKKRFLFSIGANLARAAISLLVGMMVARGLGPAEYGNLAFLLGSFWAIRALLDLGASSAFYTFIAQRQRGRSYYVVYFSWLTFQFVFSTALVAVLLPSSVLDRFWLGQNRELILIALLATFLQNQVWTTVMQLHEAARQTIRIQKAAFLLILAHLILIALFMSAGLLSIKNVLSAIVIEHIVAVIWLSKTLHDALAGIASTSNSESSIRAVLLEYFQYCRPLVVIAIFAFFYEITDRWLLQRFGGASEQGFYQVASQLSTISLLATTSILNVLWKEVAEASELGNKTRVIELYQRITHLLMLLSAFVTCFFAPWSEELVRLLLGIEYIAAWPVLFVLLFYPIHQAMGQINGTLFKATGQTRAYMWIAVSGQLVGIPLSYLMIAPIAGPWIPGLQLGAFGLALKTVLLNVLFVNIESWVITRQYEAKFHWIFQLSGILSLLFLGYVARSFGQYFMVDQTYTSILFGITISALAYFSAVLFLLLKFPGFAGLQKTDAHAVLMIYKKIVSLKTRFNK